MSHIPSSLAGGRRARYQLIQPEPIETNAARLEQPTIWACRWLDGWMGVLPDQLQMHRALRIEPYLYELQTDPSMKITWHYVDETR
ncbi:hypothetical protein BDV19DRAFT_392701 [Aspergillus venezuelensis]